MQETPQRALLRGKPTWASQSELEHLLPQCAHLSLHADIQAEDGGACARAQMCVWIQMESGPKEADRDVPETLAWEVQRLVVHHDEKWAAA